MVPDSGKSLHMRWNYNSQVGCALRAHADKRFPHIPLSIWTQFRCANLRLAHPTWLKRWRMRSTPGSLRQQALATALGHALPRWNSILQQPAPRSDGWGESTRELKGLGAIFLVAMRFNSSLAPLVLKIIIF